MEFKTIKTQIVELPIPANTTLRTFKFPTQNFLRLKQIVSMEVYTANDMSVTPQGFGLITTANLMSGFLSFYGDNPEAANAQGDWMQQIGLPSIHRLNNFIDPFAQGLYTMEPRNFVWEKSKLEFFATVGNDTDISLLLLVGYMGNEGDN